MLIAFKKSNMLRKSNSTSTKLYSFLCGSPGTRILQQVNVKRKKWDDEEDVLYSAQKDATSARTRTTEGLTQAESEKNEDI